MLSQQLLGRPLPPLANRRASRYVCRSLHSHDPLPERRWPVPPAVAVPPLQKLPPDGTTIPADEELCNPEEENCKTLLHVYEARCTACDGTGWARAPTNGRRGHLGTCMTCHGLGCVRRTTSRFCPDDPDKHMTINRPLAWNGKFAARLMPINIDKTLKHKGGSSNGSSSNNASGSSSDNGSTNG
ncbi:hypothetical protein COO60DRAFT_1521822, partial [Scenedesmus sp. NREL 46B-D3]